MSRILLFANTDWYLYNFRLSFAKELRDQGHEVIFLSPPGQVHEFLQSDGFPWIPFELSRQSINPLGELLAIWRLIRLYRKIRPNIVHHFTIKPVIYGSIAARLSGITYIINAITGLGHLFINSDPATRLLRAIASFLYRMNLGGTQVVFENPEDRDVFIQKGLSKAEQSHLILGTGVDIEKFRPRPKTNATPVVLFSSRMLVTKGLYEFIEAARQLKQKGLNARFAIAGRTDPGNPASIAEKQIEIWKQSDSFEWWGWQQDMPAALAQADIFCLPSYREGVPNALLEAAASGLAIVATDVAGCREVVSDGVNGFLVPARNSAALAEALEKVITDPELRRRMGEAGRQIAVNQFSTAKVNQETLAIYDLFLKS